MKLRRDSKGVELKLQPLAKDANLTLKDIYFESNSSSLFESSFEELDRCDKINEILSEYENRNSSTH